MPVEALTYLALAVLLIAQLGNVVGRRRLAIGRYLAVAACLATALQLLLAGYRWQMLPAYGMAGAILFASFVPLADTQRSAAWRLLVRSLAVIGLLPVALSLLLTWSFPQFTLPAPTGGYGIGSDEYVAVDHSRVETYGDGGGPRELMIRVWYPASAGKSSSPPVSYFRYPEIRSRAVTDSNPLPPFTFLHLGDIPTHTYWRAAPADGAFPVIVYTPGLGGGWAAMNTILVEDLVSRGYVVVGIDHTHLGSAAIFPDGRVIGFDEETRSMMNQPPSEAARSVMQEMMAAESWQGQLEGFKRLMALMPERGVALVRQALKVQQEDQAFVIRHLASLRDAHDWTSTLDLERVGVMGISLGGVATHATCANTALCRAGVSLDGFDLAQLDYPLLPVPFLFLAREANELFNVSLETAASDAYAVRIGDTQHFNFFDFSVMSPLYQKLGVLGRIDGVLMMQILRDSVGAFFDAHLKAAHAGPMTEPGPYPNAKVWFEHRSGVRR